VSFDAYAAASLPRGGKGARDRSQFTRTHSALPSISTVAESGLADSISCRGSACWHPPARRRRRRQGQRRTRQDRALAGLLAPDRRHGRAPRSSTAAEFRNFVRVEVDRWAGSSRAPGPGWSDAMIALGFATLAQETRHQRSWTTASAFIEASGSKRSRSGSVSHRVPGGTAAAFGARPALSHAQPVPGHPGRLRHTGTARRGSPGPCITPAHSRDTGPWWGRPV